jgi:hypothetical protein
MGVGDEHYAPGSLPGKRHGTLCIGGLGGPQGRSGGVWKISSPPGFDPGTVKPVDDSLYRVR